MKRVRVINIFLSEYEEGKEIDVYETLDELKSIHPSDMRGSDAEGYVRAIMLLLGDNPLLGYFINSDGSYHYIIPSRDKYETI